MTRRELCRYVPGSQKWGDKRPGSAKLFFDKNRFALMHDAAKKHGIENPEETLEVVQVRVGAGAFNEILSSREMCNCVETSGSSPRLLTATINRRG